MQHFHVRKMSKCTHDSTDLTKFPTEATESTKSRSLPCILQQRQHCSRVLLVTCMNVSCSWPFHAFYKSCRLVLAASITAKRLLSERVPLKKLLNCWSTFHHRWCSGTRPNRCNLMLKSLVTT